MKIKDEKLSTYIPQRKLKRFGKHLLRLDKIKIIILSLMLIVLILFVFSFMQEKMGNFTINLNRLELFRKGVTLSSDAMFTNPTSKLTAAAISEATNITITDIPDNVNMIDGEHNGDNYIAYTYYVRNAGKEDLSYIARLTLDSASKNADKAARVIVYINDEEKHVFAQPASNGKNEEGCENFLTESIVMEKKNEEFLVGNVDKYTIVIFLEGEDPECVDAIIGGAMQFSMNIVADDDNDSSLFVKWVQDIKDFVTGNGEINASGTEVPDFYKNNNNINWENRRNKE